MLILEDLVAVRNDYSQLLENFTQKLELIKSLEQDLMNVGSLGSTSLQSDVSPDKLDQFVPESFGTNFSWSI